MNKRSKILSLFLAAVLCLGLTACGSKGTASEESSVSEQATSSSEVSSEAESSVEESTAEVEAQTRTITDMAGNEVVLPKEVKRVVVLSMYPLPSAIANYLGSAEKIVGMDPFAYAAAKNGLLSQIYPEILNADTSFVNNDSVNIESLIQLKPDVVFYNAKSDEQKKMLENAGLTGVAVHAQQNDYNCIKTYNDWFELFNKVFPGEGPETSKVTEYSQKVYDEIQSRVKDIPQEERMRALFIFRYTDDKLIISGRNFFGNWWIETAGGVNVAAEIEEPAGQPVTMEQVLAWNPEIIFITNFSGAMPEDLYDNAIGGHDWSTVQAVIDRNVHKMPLGSYRTYTPGVDTPVTMLWVAKQMYPQKFEDVNIEQELKSYYKEMFDVELTEEQVQLVLNPVREAAGQFQ